MNCANWEERIALLMGNDLEAAESAEVERHLAECAGCQLFASGMREALDVLLETQAAEPRPADYAAVRARVFEELERRPLRRWLLGLASAAAVAALLLLLVWPHPARHVSVAKSQSPAAPPQLLSPVPAAVAKPAVLPVRVVPRRRKPTVPIVKAAAPATPLVVKMVTDDPDVVIYWITDTRGE